MENLGIRGVARAWFENYLSNRQQYMELDGVKSETKMITCGVPQGSILGPILFLIYINDIQKCTSLDVLSFADDTTIMSSSNDIKGLYDKMNFELGELSKWFKANKLCLNVKKTKYILFGPNRANTVRQCRDLDILIDGKTVDQISHTNSDKSFKFLGIYIDETLSWRYHIQKVCAKISSSNYIINKVKNVLPKSALKSIYLSLVHSHICYGLVLWGASKISNRVHKLQKRAIRTINHKSYNYHTDPLFKICEILKLSDQYIHDAAVLVHNLKYGKLPKTFDSLTYFTPRNQPNTRQISHAYCPRYRTTYTSLMPLHRLPRIWNDLDDNVRSIKSLSKFKSSIRSSKLTAYADIVKCENIRCQQCFPG